MWRETWLGVLSVCAFTTTIPFAAEAASNTARPPLAESPSAWTFDGGFYGWALWVQGDATARSLTFDVYADPIDLIDALDGPIIMANFEAKRGPFSLYTDVVYAKFDFDSDFLGEAQPIPALTLRGNPRVGADYEFGVYQAGAFYEIARLPGAKGKTTIELGGGARLVQQDLSITTAIDANVQLNFRNLLDRLGNRIKRIENRAERLAALAQFNALRKAILDKRIILAGDRGLEQRVARLENRLKRVDNRGDVVKALQAIDKLRLALLRDAIGLDGADISGNLAFIDSGSYDWVDPVIAMRVNHPLGNGQSVTAMGDVGGFRSDDFSWQVVLTYDRDGTFLGFDTTTSIGYKALGLLFEEQTSKGARGVDVVLHGPIAELIFRW